MNENDDYPRSPTPLPIMRKPFNLLLPAALLLLLLLLRCQWPAASGETAHIHGAIADSILNGNKWGLVALVQYPDAPLVPTLALALAKCLAAPLGLSPYALLAAVAQTLAAAILIRRLPLRRLPGLLALLSLLALPLIPLTRQAILLNDPNWLAAVPLLLALAQLDEFSHRPQLKPLIGIAANAAILVFCGPLMLLAAFLLVFITGCHLGQLRTPGDAKGLHVVLWLPFVYAILLWLPWYGADERNVFSALTAAFASQQRVWRTPLELHTPLAAAVAAFILALRAPHPLAARGLLPLLALIPAAGALARAAGLATTGLAPALVCCLAFLPVTLANQRQPDEPTPTTHSARTPLIAAALACAAALVMGIRHPRLDLLHHSMPTSILRQTAIKTPPPPDLFDYRDAPPRATLIALAHREWDGARIAICGKRLRATVYPDPKQTHFHHLPDSQPLDALRSRAATEQLFLLVPPPDTRFYPPDSPLADIHRHGAPWLFLTAQLPHGWQLWRTLPPPAPTTTDQ